MRKPAIIALVLALAGAAHGQTPQLPPAQMPPSPKSITGPKPPVAPIAPRPATPATGAGIEADIQLVLMRTAQDAQNDLRSLMAGVDDADRNKASERGATSNPCKRAGPSAAPSCIDSIKRQLARAKLPAAEKSQVEADLTVLRDSLKAAQFGSVKQREARLAEARTRAARLDATFAKLAEPRPPATVGLPLDKLIPGLGG